MRAGGMQLGVMMAKAPQLSARPVRLDEMPAGTLVDHLLASTAAFPVFPMREIGGERYIDGGFADNMPVSMALEDGVDEIIAVNLHPRPIHPQYLQQPFLREIRPLHELGGFLNFEHRQMQRSRMLGYNDTMKHYGRFDGIRYTFLRVSDLKLSDVARKYAKLLACIDARCDESRLLTEISGETPLRRLSWKETLLRGLELAAHAMLFREDAVYDMEELTARIIAFAKSCDPEGCGFIEAAKSGSRRLTAWLFNAVREDANYAFDNAERLAAFPTETAAALYLKCMDDQV